METTFMLRFKKQPNAFKKCIKKYSKDERWYEPSVAFELYREIVENEEVDGMLEIELKCLASNKKIMNVRFEIDKSQNLDELIYHTLQEEMGNHEGLTQLFEDLRHAFKWDEKERSKDIEKKQISNGEIKIDSSKDEKSQCEDWEEAESHLLDVEEAVKLEPTVEVDLFDDLIADWVLDESMLVSPSTKEIGVGSLPNVQNMPNQEMSAIGVNELSSIVLMRNKMVEIEMMAKKSTDHLLDVLGLTDKTDPISIKKQGFIKYHYAEMFLAFLRNEYQCCGEKKQFIEKEAQEQLEAKSRGIQSEKRKLVEMQLASVRFGLETTYAEKKQAEIQKLEQELKQEFEEILHTRRAELEQITLSDLTPEQKMLMKANRDEVEQMIKERANIVVDESTARYQVFINEMKADLQFKQLEFEIGEERLELKRMQEQMIEMMQKTKVEADKDHSTGMVGFITLIAMVVVIFITLGFLFFSLSFVREAVADFLG